MERAEAVAAAVAAEVGEQTPGTPRRPARPPLRQRVGVWRLLRANLYDLRQLTRESWPTLTLFGVVLATGSGYEYLHGHPYLPEAIYTTLQLLLFQQSNERFPPDPLGQTLFFLLPLLGLLVIVQSVLNVGRRFLDKGSRQEGWQVSLATTFRRHIIVCGLGRIGVRVVTRLLEAGYEVVVVERDFRSRFVARALDMRVPVIAGDASEIATLRQAGLGRARAVIADINNDQLDIEIALAARTARPGMRVILRAFNEDLDRNLERIFGPDSAFSHSALAAPTIAAAAVSRDIRYAFPIGDELVGIVQLTLRPGSQLAGSVNTYEERTGVRVLNHHSASGKLVRADQREVFHIGDHVTMLGTLSALEVARLSNAVPSTSLPPQHPIPGQDTVIVCGLGKVGYRVVQRLARLTPRPDIVAVHLPGGDDASFAQRIADLPGVRMVEGDARDVEVLERAGLDHAYSVAAVTSDDLTNLEIGLASRGRRSDVHLVLRVFSDALADELNTAFTIRTTYSTSNLASPTLAAAAILQGLQDGGVSRAFTAAGQIFSSDEFTALPGGVLSGLTVEQVRLKHGILVVALARDGRQLLLPPLDTIVQPGDKGTLVARLEALERLARQRRRDA